MTSRLFARTVLATALSATILPAQAFDARAIALGGSNIADGHGVSGALANPASMMRMQRKDQRIHLRLGVAGEIRDNGELLSEALDNKNEDLIDDIDEELAAIDGDQLECDLIGQEPDDVCLRNVGGLGSLAGRLLDLAEKADGEVLTSQAGPDLGAAWTASDTPIAVHLGGRITVAATPEISAGDRAYIGNFEDILSDDELTRGEIESSAEIDVNEGNGTLNVQQPEEVLSSEADGNYLIRTQLGIGLARALSVAGINLDMGVTPKFSQLTASSNRFRLNEEFAENQPSVEDRFDANEVTETSFTFDVGASASVFAVPLRLGAVLRNVIPESIETEEGYEFETTPQLIAGAVFDIGLLALNADVALNEAKLDNFETQTIALGAEFTPLPFARLRAGISTDLAREDSATALSLGAGLGPVHLGARISGLEAAQFGAEISLSF